MTAISFKQSTLLLRISYIYLEEKKNNNPQSIFQNENICIDDRKKHNKTYQMQCTPGINYGRSVIILFFVTSQSIL